MFYIYRFQYASHLISAKWTRLMTLITMFVPWNGNYNLVSLFLLLWLLLDRFFFSHNPTKCHFSTKSFRSVILMHFSSGMDAFEIYSQIPNCLFLILSTAIPYDWILNTLYNTGNYSSESKNLIFQSELEPGVISIAIFKNFNWIYHYHWMKHSSIHGHKLIFQIKFA